MTRNQFISTIAAIPFIGKMFKPTPKYIPFGSGIDYPSYQFYGRPNPDRVKFITYYDSSIQFGEPAVIDIGERVELEYIVGFKPGDRIFIEPTEEYPNGNYVIDNNWTLKNEKTGMQASTKILHSHKEYATWDEMNQTHGIRGFEWRPV